LSCDSLRQGSRTLARRNARVTKFYFVAPNIGESSASALFNVTVLAPTFFWRLVIDLCASGLGGLEGKVSQ